MSDIAAVIVSTFMLTLALSSPAHAEPSPAVLAAARLRQEWTPEFRRRRDIAREQIKASNQYFEGDLELLGAWPELNGAPMLSRPYIQGSLLQLDQRAEQRNAERMTPAPSELLDRDAARYLKERAEAITAEEETDQLKRRLLVGLSAGLKAAPGLSQADIDAQIAQWRALVAELPPETDPGYADAAKLAQITGELEIILRRYEQAAILSMTVPGDLSLLRLSSADLARQATTEQTALEADAAADRLRRVLPMLPEDTAAEVQVFLNARTLAKLDEQLVSMKAEVAAAQAALEAVTAPESAAEKPALEAAAAAATAELAKITAETASMLSGEPPAKPIPLRKREIAEQRVALADLKAQIAAERLRLVPAERVQTAEEGAVQAQAQVDDAQRKANDARLKAEAAGKAELSRIANELQTLSNDLAQREPDRQAEVAAQLKVLKDKQETQQAILKEAFLTPPLGRQEALRRAYATELKLVEQIRQQIRVRQRAVSAVVADNAKIRREKIPSDAELTKATELDSDLLISIQESVEATEEALVGRRTQAVLEQDEVARMLRVAREDARLLREALPPSVRASVEQAAGYEFPRGSIEESIDIAPLFAEQARSIQTTESWTIPGILRRILLFLESSFALVVILILWRIARRQGAAWVEQSLRFLQRLAPSGQLAQRPWLDVDLDGLQARLEPVVRPAVGVITGWLAYALLSGPSPLMGLLALVWVGWSTLRLVRPLVEVVFVEKKGRTLGFVVSPKVRALARSTGRQLARWWVAAILLHQISYAVLHTDQLSDRISSIMALILAGLLLRELHRWSPTVVEVVRSQGGESRVNHWVISESRGPLGRLLRGVVGLGVLVMSLSQQVTSFFVEGRGRMGWVGALIAQHSLKEMNKDCPPLTEEEHARLLKSHERIFLHSGEVAKIAAAYAQWCDNHRRGMVAVVGDHGAGKSLLLKTLREGTIFGEHPIQQMDLYGLLEDDQEARAWLSEQLSIPNPEGGLPSWKLLRDTMMSRPPQVFLIDDAHRLMLRAVGGFTGLRETMAFMHATGERHFWVATFHGLAWSFLEGSATPINLDAFRAPVRIAPLDPARVSRWMTEMTEGAGMRFRFNNLSPAILPSTAEASRELKRIEAAFWRRMTDVTLGNPEVILSYWLRSLRHPIAPPVAADTEPDPAAEPEPEVLDIALLEPLDVSAVETLPDIDLFVLTAIVIHDGLGIADLSRSLNAARGQIRASCRQLEGLEVLERGEHGQFRVRAGWRPTVSRLLRQRHFLHQR